jgi:hypothetical protein
LPSFGNLRTFLSLVDEVKGRTSDFAKMSPAAAVSVSQLALPVGAMPAVGFGCWKLGKDIAADTSKENSIDL